MKLNLRTLSLAISLVVCSIVLFLHGYLGYFSRYIADDFCTAYYAHHLGILRSTWFWYLNWSGRFSASLLDAMIGSLGPYVLPAIVPLTIILWLLTLTVFFLNFLHGLNNRFLTSLVLAVASLFTLFLLTPDIRQSLYWGQGMRSVVPPLIIGTIQIILLRYLRSRDWTKMQHGIWGVLGFLGAFLAGGFSETYAAFQVAALLVALLAVVIIERFRLSTISLFLASSFLGALCALTLVVLAPGNSERQAFFPSHPGIMGILSISSTGFLTYLLGLINSYDKIAAILGLYSLSALIGAKRSQEMDSRLLWAVPILTLGSMFICFPPAAYGTSEPPPGRTLILPTYFFLMGILAWGTVSGNRFAKNQGFFAFKLLPGIVMIAFLISASTHSIDLYQSKAEFIAYAKEWDKTDVSIRQAKQNGEVQVSIPVYANWAGLNSPNDNPNFWVNRCMSRYYDVQILASTNAFPISP